jgi:hypothetical protein
MLKCSQRFKFCGDDDCPDWLLGQVSNLSKLSHIKLKLLLQTIVKNILAGEVDYKKIQKFTSDAKFSELFFFFFLIHFYFVAILGYVSVVCVIP